MLQYHFIFDTVQTQMAFVLYFFLFIFLSHPTLSHSISTSSDPALSPPSLSNRPLSSEGWVPMWVYSGMGSSMGQVTVWHYKKKNDLLQRTYCAGCETYCYMSPIAAHFRLPLHMRSIAAYYYDGPMTHHNRHVLAALSLDIAAVNDPPQ